MTTAEVLRVVGVHRVTLFRWTRKGSFPPKQVSGGWLRSDIEQWLSHRAPAREATSAPLQPSALRATSAMRSLGGHSIVRKYGAGIG